MLSIIIMMSNYFHDFAAALLVTSGLAVYFLAKSAEDASNREVVRFYVLAHRRFTLLGRIAFAWIIGAGVIRLVTYEDFEWANAVGNDQVPALIVKHIMMFTAVGAGIYFWRRLSQKVTELESKYGVDDLEKHTDPLPVGRRVAANNDR